MLNFILWLEQEQIEEQLSNCKNLAEIKNILTQNKISYFFPKTKSSILVFSLDNKKFVIDDFEYPSPMDVIEWIYHVESDLDKYINMPDFNDSFWKTVPPREGHVYHGTTKEKLPVIKSRGLIPKCETRGISNRGTGCAIFTSENLYSTQQYYPIVLEIDISLMKKDKYMPKVSQEEPIEVSEMLHSLANLLGIAEEFNHEVESGLEFDTVIFWDHIPPKYISEVESK